MTVVEFQWLSCIMTSCMRAGENFSSWPQRMYEECVLRRSISLLREKTDRLHVLIIATQRGGVLTSESNGRIGVHYVTLIAHTVFNVCVVQWGGWEGMNKPHLQLNLHD